MSTWSDGLTVKLASGNKALLKTKFLNMGLVEKYFLCNSISGVNFKLTNS